MEKKVVMGIVLNEGNVLLVKRKPGEGSLLWQFPGGTVEFGETAEDAVIRELKEETGVIVKPIETIGERVHPYTKKFMSYIACEYLGGNLEVNDDDLELAEWVDVHKLGDYFTTQLYEKVAEYLETKIC